MVRELSRLKRSSTLFICISLFGIALIAGKSLLIFGQELLSKQGLELTPPSQEIQADPGQTVTVKVKVRNPSGQSLPIVVHVEDFTASGDEGQIALVDQGKYTVTKWTTVSPSTFTLPPKGERDVTARISVPDSAAGGRYGALVFGISPQLTEEQKKNSATISQEIASLFLLKIKGPVTENLILQKISAPAFSEFGPIALKLRLTNSGNIHAKTTGLIHVTDLFGRTTADIVLKPTNVFPGADRIVTVTLSKGLLIGPYKATAALYYGADNNVLNASTTFIVLPVRVIALLVVVLVILYAGRKRFKKASKALFG